MRLTTTEIRSLRVVADSLPLIGDRKIDIVIKTPQTVDFTFLDLIEKKKKVWQKS